MKNSVKFHSNTLILILIFYVIGLTEIFSVTLAQNVPWLQKANMPTGRHSFATSVVNGKIYAIGGRYTVKLLNEYDPATDTWTTKIPMPTERMLLATGVVNGNIYAIGGIVTAYNPALSTVEEYNPVTDTWKRKKDMSTTRLGLGTSVVDGKIYAIGGMTSGSAFWSGVHRTVEMYDPLTDTWSTKADMPTARVWFSTSVVEGKIYAIGGALVTREPLSTVEVYDPTTDTWTTKTPMPTARAAHAAAVVDGIIYVIGGGTVSAQPGGFSVVEAYDPATDTWTRKADIPAPRASLSTSGVGGKIYAIGGIPTFADPHLTGLRTVYEYDPSKDLTTLVKTFNISKCFAIAGSDSICITTKINDPTGITLLAEIESPDQTPIESLPLFDDGKHNDGNSGDSLYANIWQISSAEERYYFVDLEVTQIGTDTIINHINNVALFTTIGPVVFENYTLGSSDTEPNPGDKLNIKLTLKNEGSTATASNVTAKLISLDTLATVETDAYLSLKDIKPGESNTTSNYYRIKISNNCPEGAEIKFALEITSNDYAYWRDTFSVFTVSSVFIEKIKKNVTSQFSLNQNYPNPFNPATTINYSLPSRNFVTLKVYNSLGKELQTLVSEFVDAGWHAIQFDASNFSSGLYFYRLQAGDWVETRKMLLMK